MILFLQKDYARDLMLLSLQITCSIKVNDEFGLQVGNYLWFIFMTVKQFGLFFQAKKIIYRYIYMVNNSFTYKRELCNIIKNLNTKGIA